MNQAIVTVRQPPALDYLDMNRLIDIFIEEADIKPKSQKTYRQALVQFVNYIGEKPNMIDRVDIINYKKSLFKRGLKNTSVAVYIAAVRQLFEFLESAQIFPNIARNIKMPKIVKEFKRSDLTVKQVKKLLSSIKLNTPYNIRDYAIINLMVRTGLRDIEVHRADIGDIEQLEEATVLKIQQKGHDAKDKLVILRPATLKPILKYLKGLDDHSPDNPLFISLSDLHYGHRLDPGSISRIVKTRLRKAGINSKYYTAHSLRHTAATVALKAGAPIEKVKEMLGHQSINTTLLYTHMNRFEDSAESAISKAF